MMKTAYFEKKTKQKKPKSFFHEVFKKSQLLIAWVFATSFYPSLKQKLTYWRCSADGELNY